MAEDLSFKLIVQKFRREYMRDAIMATDPEKKRKGKWILENVK